MKYALSILLTVLLWASATSPVFAGQPENNVGSKSLSTPTNQLSLLGLPNGPSPLEVHAEFHLLDLQKIYDETETFEFSGVLTLVWKDSRQAFDPAVTGAKEVVYNGSYQFNELAPAWYPQAVLVNASEVKDMQGLVLRIQSDGSSTLVQTVNAIARSALNLRKYPFDSQRLELVFEILGFDNTEVAIVNGNVTVNSRRILIPQWDLIDVDTSSRSLVAPYVGATASSAALVVAFDVRRQSFFMLRLVVFPLMLIMMLSWAVFWMDRSSLGDRMSVSFVGVLTAVAYQTMVSSIMPQISYVTLIHGFLYFSFLLMCAPVVMNLVVGNCDKRGDFDRGDIIDRRCRWLFPSMYAGLISVLLISAFTWF